jgi:hypothetical protein
MSRTILIIAFLLAGAGTSRSTQTIYPPLTRETLNGTWEALFGIGTHPTVLHIVIAPKNEDSYLSVMDPPSMKGNVFRMDSCTVTGGKVKLHFVAFWPVGDGSCWWFDGNGFGDEIDAWIEVHFGNDRDPKPQPGTPTLHLEKGMWVSRLGEASKRAAKDIANARDKNKR